MKTILQTLLLIFISNYSFSQITDPSPYCSANFEDNTNYNLIKEIYVEGQYLFIGDVGSWGVPDGYKYFNTSTLADLTKGSSALIEITFHYAFDGEPQYFALWIDYNQNNTFETSELVMQNSNTIKKALPVAIWTAGTEMVALSITIPTTATTGKTRARLMRRQHPDEAKAYDPYDPNAVLDPCYTPDGFGYAYGNTYDFDVNISATTVNVNDLNTTTNSFDVYPNPTSDMVHFTPMSNNLSNAKISVLNSLGQILPVTIENNSINLQSYPSGIYFVSVSNSEGQQITKLIKE